MTKTLIIWHVSVVAFTFIEPTTAPDNLWLLLPIYRVTFSFRQIYIIPTSLNRNDLILVACIIKCQFLYSSLFNLTNSHSKKKENNFFIQDSIFSIHCWHLHIISCVVCYPHLWVKVHLKWKTSLVPIIFKCASLSKNVMFLLFLCFSLIHTLFPFYPKCYIPAYFTLFLRQSSYLQ